MQKTRAFETALFHFDYTIKQAVAQYLSVKSPRFFDFFNKTVPFEYFAILSYKTCFFQNGIAHGTETDREYPTACKAE